MPQVRSRVRRPAPVSEGLQQIGERIRRARVEAGLSQGQLGAPHFTRAYISAIELGKVRPAMKSLEFLAEKLGKPAAFFMEDADAERRRQERELSVKSAEALLNRSTAAQAVEMAESLLESSTSPQERCRLHLILGTAHNFLVEGTKALSHLAAADTLAQLASEATRHRIKYQMALAYRHSGNSPQSILALRHLLDELERSHSSDRLLKLRVVKDLGVISIDSGDIDAAGAYLHTALEWAKDIGDISGLVSIYNALGYAHRAKGDLEAATGYIQRALSLNEAVHDLTATAALLNSLAVIAAERGHFDAARQHVERAILIIRGSGPAANLPHAICTKAEIELKSGDWATAEQSGREALEVAQQVGNQRAAAAAKVLLADVEVARGASAAGQDQLEEAAAIYQALGAATELGDTYMRLSNIARDRNDSRSAQSYADMAFHVTRKKGGLIER